MNLTLLHVNSEAVIPAKAGIQRGKKTGFRVKPGMTIKVKRFMTQYTRKLQKKLFRLSCKWHPSLVTPLYSPLKLRGDEGGLGWKALQGLIFDIGKSEVQSLKSEVECLNFRRKVK